MTTPNTLLHRQKYDPLHSMSKWHARAGQKAFIGADEKEQEKIKFLRAKLILEEALEVIEELGYDAVFTRDHNFELSAHGRDTSYENLAKELADLKVVTYGTDEVFDIPAYPVFNEVMRSNFSKFDPKTGEPEYRFDGKILKGVAYKAPDINGALTGNWR